MSATEMVPPERAYELLTSGKAEAGLRIHGTLDYSGRSKRALPAVFPSRMTADCLNVAETGITELPSGLSVQVLDASSTPVQVLPEDLRIRTRLNLAGCDRLESLPNGLRVGSLNVRGCTELRSLPEELDVWFLDLSGCWAFNQWPTEAQIRSGQLQLRGCTALTELPHYVRRLSALNVRVVQI